MSKLKIMKQNLVSYALAGTLIVTGISMTGCSKEKQPEPSNLSYIQTYVKENDLTTIYITEYDSEKKEVVIQELEKEDYADINSQIVSDIGIDEQAGIIYTYFCDGYLAGSKYTSLEEAMKINQKFQGNSMFIEGYEAASIDKILKQAEAENRQYIQIYVENAENKKLNGINYYPVEELSVVSYEDYNAIVRNYEEESVVAGQYQDLLGKNMTTYAKKPYDVSSLSVFTHNHYDEIEDAEYISVGHKKIIPQISNKTFVKGKTESTKTK